MVIRAFVVLASMIGCGGGSGPSFDHVKVSEFRASLHAALCVYEARCGMAPDYTSCERATFGHLDAEFDTGPNIEADVAAGTLLYDETQAAACLHAIADETCDRTDHYRRLLSLACFTLLRGTVASGGTCSYLPNEALTHPNGIVTECVSQQCNYSCGPGIDPCCTGTCVGDTPPSIDPPAIGQPCGRPTDLPCADGGYCDASMVPAMCRAMVPAGSPCSSELECDDGLWCAGSPRICKPLPARGEPCPDGECRDEGTYCNSAAICAKVAMPGEPCDGPDACTFTFSGAVCDATMHCAKLPSLGDACTPPASNCIDASFCDRGSSQCVALAADGSACTSDRECESGYCDDNASPAACSTPAACL